MRLYRGMLPNSSNQIPIPYLWLRNITTSRAVLVVPYFGRLASFELHDAEQCLELNVESGSQRFLRELPQDLTYQLENEGFWLVMVSPVGDMLAKWYIRVAS